MTPEQTQAYYQDNSKAQIYAMLVVSFGAFLGPVTLATVNVALPTIANALNADAVLIGWVPTIFLLGNIALMLPFSKLADNIGRKRVYLIGIITNTVGTLLAAMANDVYWLIACRFIQGVASAMIFGCSMAILTSVFPPNKRGLPLGVNAFALYCGLAAAPALGGWATEYLGWRSVFWIQVPALFCLMIAITRLKGEWKNPSVGKFDWLGSSIFAVWSVCLVVGLSGLPKLEYSALLLVGIACLVWFIKHQKTVANPLVRLSLFTEHKGFTLSLIATVAMYAASYPISIIASMYLQYIQGMSPSQAGHIMLLQAVAMAPLAPIAGKLSDKLNARIIAAIGCVFALASFISFSQVHADSPVIVISLIMLGLGVGYGFFTTPNNNVAMHSIERKELGAAAALINLSRTTGNTIGMGIVTLLISHYIGSTPITENESPLLLQTIQTSLVFASVYCFIALCLSLAGKKGQY